MKIRMFRPTPKGLWYFQVTAANGKIVAQSEGYNNREDCLKTMNSLKWKLIFAQIVEDD